MHWCLGNWDLVCLFPQGGKVSPHSCVSAMAPPAISSAFIIGCPSLTSESAPRVIFPKWLPICEFSRSAITKCHNLIGLDNSNRLPYRSGGQKYEVKVSPGLAPCHDCVGGAVPCLFPNFCECAGSLWLSLAYRSITWITAFIFTLWYPCVYVWIELPICKDTCVGVLKTLSIFGPSILLMPKLWLPSWLPVPGPQEVNVCPDPNVGRLVLPFPKVAHGSLHFKWLWRTSVSQLVSLWITTLWPHCHAPHSIHVWAGREWGQKGSNTCRG